MNISFNIDGEECEHTDTTVVLISVIKQHKSGLQYSVHTTISGDYIGLCRAYTALGAAISQQFQERNKEAIKKMEDMIVLVKTFTRNYDDLRLMPRH